MMNGFLDPYLSPILNSFGILGFVIFIALLVSLITIIVYKYTTDQTLMRNLKEETERLNKEAKKYMHDQKKAMSLQKQVFEKQMIVMKHSFTSTFITFLPIIILFGWLNANLAYAPITEGQEFTVSVLFDNYAGKAELLVPKEITVDSAVKDVKDNEADWKLTGKEGEYLLELKVGDKSYTKDVIITDKQKYAEALKNINDGTVKNIQIQYKTEKILNLFGWKLGWLGSYIIFALLFSIVLRKLLKVY